ncbi:MAG: restriction endonuclease subunit S [Candidatus Absconditicoccaceae bacterium]
MTNTVNKKTNEEEISIIISAEHADYLNEIEECFPGLTIDPCYIRKSRGELPMKIIIFLGGAIMSGLTWDIIKLGIQKVYDKFSKKELDFSIKFENMFFSINKDGRVKAITLDHEQFSHIKTLDDLYVYIQEKAQSKMPNVDWKATTLGEITQMNLESISTNFGYDKILYLDTGSITENKIEQLQTVEIKDAPSRAKRLVKEGDIIYSTVRPNQKHFGFMKNLPKNLVVSTGFTVISPEKDIDGKFIYYYITQNYITEKLHQIAEQAVSAYPSIRPENIKQLPIHLPPLPEQQAIAAVLSSFDDKIELLRAENQTLEPDGAGAFQGAIW